MCDMGSPNRANAMIHGEPFQGLGDGPGCVTLAGAHSLVAMT